MSRAPHHVLRPGRRANLDPPTESTRAAGIVLLTALLAAIGVKVEGLATIGCGAALVEPRVSIGSVGVFRRRTTPHSEGAIGDDEVRDMGAKNVHPEQFEGAEHDGGG